MISNDQFSDFASTIRSHTLEQLYLQDHLKIGQSGHLSSYYAPFEAINSMAQVIFVGICPGKAQWQHAIEVAKTGLESNIPPATLLQKIKAESAFRGPMRRNIVQMLDYVGLQHKLGIETSQQLFEKNQHLLHSTSALRHCILNKGQNYNGSTPNMLRNEFLQQHIHSFLIPEIQQLSSSAVYIPMGLSVAQVLHYLSSLGYLNEGQILDGFPHPSGANSERIQYFLGQKTPAQLSKTTNAYKIDQEKINLSNKIRNLEFK
ncbi:hypothetical protein D9K79_09095 [Acinetobacter cumulans]|uniref:Uncharacterized protein n=1 Tax=Acinetobacter cumulans TaxID=2136182 RepID=A0ABX9U5U0_9GAMM|nr:MULTISPECIES: hypothetical protein [Acinetobacter]NWK75422.1 hypothetical protein [Acinetobacter sp. SwsAc6]RFS34562.1 hypothetical protein DYI81_03420 [Acinetobacter sp. SWAC5]RKG47457.1 hypothetical protein D7V68_11540 [Acinetobacter cumulans]RLL45562.1 hypothetical protein D9K79_09095 [Acinetobacter cumulans]